MAVKQAARRRSDESGLWPEEIEAMKNIKSGKTKMTTMTAEEFNTEMEKYMNERKKREMAARKTKRLAKTT